MSEPTKPNSLNAGAAHQAPHASPGELAEATLDHQISEAESTITVLEGKLTAAENAKDGAKIIALKNKLVVARATVATLHRVRTTGTAQ